MPEYAIEMGGRGHRQAADATPIYGLSQTARTTTVPSIKEKRSLEVCADVGLLNCCRQTFSWFSGTIT